MERDTNQMSQSGSLCRSGCGFYGNPASDGLCSKCYKDALKRKQSAPTSSQTSSNSVGSHAVSSAGRNSPLGTSNVESNLPLLSPPSSSTIDNNSLNTASPTVPSAIISPAQDSALQENSKQENAVANSDISASTLPSAESQQSDPPKTQEKKKAKTRCGKCKAKVSVMGFPCRCGGVFCSLHRYADEHNCTFDYREAGAEEIRRNNPQIIGEKIQKI